MIYLTTDKHGRTRIPPCGGPNEIIRRRSPLPETVAEGDIRENPCTSVVKIKTAAKTISGDTTVIYLTTDKYGRTRIPPYGGPNEIIRRRSMLPETVAEGDIRENPCSSVVKNKTAAKDIHG